MCYICKDKFNFKFETNQNNVYQNLRPLLFE